MKKLLKPCVEGFKTGVRWFIAHWPFGYLCDFEWDTQGRIRVTKQLWVIVGDKKKDGSTDALPLVYCSQALVDRVAEELGKKWYAPPFMKKPAAGVSNE